MPKNHPHNAATLPTPPTWPGVSSAFPFQTFAVGKGQLILGDCLEVMRQLPEGLVTLAVTSPPYLNAINYEEHVEKLNGKKGRWERKEVSYDEYRDFLKDRFRELLRITTPGGYNVVNIAPVLWQGKRTALPFHFVSWMEEIGWTFKEDIVWEKPVARDRRSGLLLQHPYPGYYYPSLVAEYVFVFQKSTGDRKLDNIYWHRGKNEKDASRLDLSDYQGEKSKNVWKIRPMAPQENLHPCPYPLALVERVVEFYSYKDDVVLDVFTGSGQTNLAAEKLGRRHIGIDTARDYLTYAADRMKNHLRQGRRLDDEASEERPSRAA